MSQSWNVNAGMEAAESGKWWLKVRFYDNPENLVRVDF